MYHPTSRRLLWLSLLALQLLAPAAFAAGDAHLAEARQYIDDGRPEDALAILDQLLKKGKPDPRALLLRSTGRAMVADLEGAYKDLQKALKLDPTLRQGWLDLAGLEIAEGRYVEAYDALLEAQKLDPGAPENHLNLGAVLVMQGKLDEADGHFARYLENAGASADAYFLVASNYAMAGRQEPALEHLQQAIAIDERSRLRARADNRFLTLDEGLFQRLLNTDSYQPPPGAHTRSAAFETPYNLRDNRLLYAVLRALDVLGLSYDPAVETTAGWALVWSEMRIKVHNQSNGTGVVSLSAPAESFTADGWQRRSQELLQAIHRILSE